jgi:hypothetical protein|tara:strand:+ start:683 stop:976 length:294 start_codon:yes stop_codon:yes gene_type:complete
MNPVLPSNRLLYLLAAILLFMQSFAIWHDSSHPFHQASQECSKFEAVSHTPSADLANAAILLNVPSIASIELVISTPLRLQYLQGNHPIRAPPTVFS